MNRNFRQTSSSSFEREILPHLDLAWRMALTLARDPVEAEDLAQEALLRAMRGFHRFTPGTNARSWLARVVHTAWLDHLRGESRRPRGTWDEELDETLADGEDSGAWQPRILSEALDDQWEAALAELPSSWRLTLLLVEVEGLSYEEAAHATGVPVGTVRSRLHRAKDRLHAWLSKRGRS